MPRRPLRRPLGVRKTLQDVRVYRKWLRRAWRPSGRTRSSKLIRLWIPEVVIESDPREDPGDFVRGGAARVRLEPRRIPDHRKLPKLIHGHEGSERHTAVRTPGSNRFFRPEEEHVRSGEDKIIPPPRSWDEAMEKPARR